MTTPNTDLRDRIARALAAHEGFDADHLDHEFVVGEWHDTAAALVPIVEAAVKAGKAEAWEEGTEAVEYDYEVRGFLRIPDDNPYREETPDEQ